MNGLNNLMTQQMRVNKLQEQLSSGLKVKSAADDPISFSQIESLNQRISTTELLQKNCINAQNALNLEESLLSDCMDNLQRLRVIQVQAGDGTLSEAQRKSLSIEATEILNQLQAFANTKDNDGNYMFAGGQTATEPFTLNAAGQYVYNGDSTQRFQLIGGSLQIAINDPGDSVFMRIPGGNGSFTVNTPSTNTGSVSASTGSVTNTASYVPDDYSIGFSLNSAGELVVMVSGAVSGSVIPSTGLPDDAPLYQTGMSLSFNGISIELSGIPQPGDSLSIAPEQNVSLFGTIQSLIANLNAPYNTAADRAKATTENNQILTQLDSAMNNISNIISNIGSRLVQVATTIDSNEDLILASRIALKPLQEVDPLVAAEDLNIQLVNLQAAQQSFVRIQNLSLFNYI